LCALTSGLSAPVNGRNGKAGSRLGNHRLDPIDSIAHCLVLPHPHHLPACSLEQAIGFAVPRFVVIQLGAPELPIDPRARSVERTSMPEAPVHEHCNADASEHQIGRASDAREWTQ
jgi:hypothetical protein